MKFNPILRHNYRIEHFAHTNQVVNSKKSPAFSLILCFVHSSTLSFLLKTHQFSGNWKTKWNSTFNEGKKKRKFSLKNSRKNLLISCIHAFITCIFFIESVCPSFKLSGVRLETAISSTNVSTYQTLEHCLKWVPILAVLNRKLLFWYWGRIHPDHPQLGDAISFIFNIQWFS